MHSEDTTSSGPALPPGLTPDAIDHLLDAVLAGRPFTPVWVYSAGIVDTRAGPVPIFVRSPYLGGEALLLLFAGASLAPLHRHRFSFFGLRVDPEAPDLDPGPRWALALPDGRGLCVRFWRQRVGWEQSPLWGDRLTLPNMSPLDGITGLEQPHTARDREHAWHALTLLTEHQARRAYTPAEGETRARQRLLEAAKRWGGPPAKLQRRHIREAEFVARTTVDDWFTDAGWKLPALRAAYQAEIARKNRANRADLSPEQSPEC